MTNLDKYPQAQADVVRRMLAAPAGGWRMTGIVKGEFLGVPCEGVAIRIESPKLKVWGVVMPDGEFIKPRPGRSRIQVLDIVYKL